MKTLVVYFSLTSNTKRVAQLVAKYTDAKIIRIQPKHKYSKSYLPTFFACVREGIFHLYPQVKNDAPKLDKYDLIVIGSPIWGGGLPHVVYSFLNKCDLDNKKIALFTTADKAGTINICKVVAKKFPNSQIISACDAKSADNSEIKNWVKLLKKNC